MQRLLSWTKSQRQALNARRLTTSVKLQKTRHKAVPSWQRMKKISPAFKSSSEPLLNGLYLVESKDPSKRGIVEKMILPVHGYGLWSTMYGFIALWKPDLQHCIRSAGFYEHAERHRVWVAKSTTRSWRSIVGAVRNLYDAELMM